MKNKKIFAVLILMLLLLSLTFFSGCKIIKQSDLCEIEYTNCVYDCDEGILSGICKVKMHLGWR